MCAPFDYLGFVHQVIPLNGRNWRNDELAFRMQMTVSLTLAVMCHICFNLVLTVINREVGLPEILEDQVATHLILVTC